MRVRPVFFLFFLLLFCSFAYSYSAMGVTPAIKRVVYTGQEEISGEVTVLPDGEKNIRIYAKSEFGDGYVFFENNKTDIDIRANGPTTISYSFRPPKVIKPGTYETHIVFSQFFTEEEQAEVGGFASALAAVGFVIKLRVPNEGKFLEATMERSPVRARIGENIRFTITALNFGTEDLINLGTDIMIRNPEGELIDKLPTNIISTLIPGNTGKLNAVWKSEGYGAGIYTAEAKINYGGDYPAEPKIDFKVGDILVKILGVSTQLNESIGKIFVNIRSNWNDLIENVYVEVIIRNGSKIMGRAKSSSVDLASWAETTLTTFLERRSLPAGEYDLDIIVHYADKEETESIKIELPELDEMPSPFGGSSMLLIVTVSLLVIILIINMLWFLSNLKNKKDNKKRKKR